jgi:hypothetical protein
MKRETGYQQNKYLKKITGGSVFFFIILLIPIFIFLINLTPNRNFTYKAYSSFFTTIDSKNRVSIQLLHDDYDKTIIHIPFIYKKSESSKYLYFDIGILDQEYLKSDELIKSYKKATILHFLSYKQDGGEEKVLISSDINGDNPSNYNSFFSFNQSYYHSFFKGEKLPDENMIEYIEGSKITFTIEFSINSKRYKITDNLVAEKPQKVKDSLIKNYLLFFIQ